MGTMRSIILILALWCLLSSCATPPPPPSEELLQQRRAAASARINASLQAQHQILDDCRTIQSAQRLNGTLVLRFQVQADGTTRRPHVFEDIGQSAQIDHCLEEAALQLKFEPLPYGVVGDVNYAIRFKPTRAPASVRR
jgi:hypothetical protein